MTEEEIVSLRVQLALEGFSGLFDNEITNCREWWYEGTCAFLEKRTDATPLWCEPNPDWNVEKSSLRAAIENMNRKRKADTKAQLD